jgi:Spy/CpxP family protein refolding chaperone
MKRAIVLAATLLAALPVLAHDGHEHGGTPPVAPNYAAPQPREIKALSPQEQRGWTEGENMGMARAAELNGYPGPMMVLEMAQALKLSPEQMAATRELMTHHKAEVRKLGAELVDAERQLDVAFREHRAEEAEVSRLTAQIGQLQGRIRASHLKTHVAEQALLTPEQMQRYMGMHGMAH